VVRSRSILGLGLPSSANGNCEWPLPVHWNCLFVSNQGAFNLLCVSGRSALVIYVRKLGALGYYKVTDFFEMAYRNCDGIKWVWFENVNFVAIFKMVYIAVYFIASVAVGRRRFAKIQWKYWMEIQMMIIWRARFRVDRVALAFRESVLSPRGNTVNSCVATFIRKILFVPRYRRLMVISCSKSLGFLQEFCRKRSQWSNDM